MYIKTTVIPTSCIETSFCFSTSSFSFPDLTCLSSSCMCWHLAESVCCCSSLSFSCMCGWKRDMLSGRVPRSKNYRMPSYRAVWGHHEVLYLQKDSKDINSTMFIWYCTHTLKEPTKIYDVLRVYVIPQLSNCWLSECMYRVLVYVINLLLIAFLKVPAQSIIYQ